MHDVVRMPFVKLKELFALTAHQMSMPPGIVEKDFWVVWMLDYLFARSPWKAQLAFKGGTSLSKAYGLIRRSMTFRFWTPLSRSSASSTVATGRITNGLRRRKLRSSRRSMRLRRL